MDQKNRQENETEGWDITELRRLAEQIKKHTDQEKMIRDSGYDQTGHERVRGEDRE